MERLVGTHRRFRAGPVPGVVATSFIFLLAFASCSPSGTSADNAANPLIHRSPGGDYVFPVSAPIEHLEWTEYHWDGANAVDIFASRSLDARSEALAEVHSAPVLAVADGTAFRVDNPRGGTAVLLQADSGKSFYYSHLAETSVTGELGAQAEGTPVSRGETIGSIGRSGSRTQFIEPHLHFEVIEGEPESIGWSDDINAARWIRRTFGFRWIDENIAEYNSDTPEGFPLEYASTPVEGFDSMAGDEPQTAGILFHPQPGSSVRSLHEGEIRVMRDTELGLRVQITNRPTDTTIVYSYLESTDLETGDTVTRGQKIGAAGDRLHVMYFEDGQARDPESIPGWHQPEK